MNIEKLLKPKSIAVVGASSNVSRVGGRLYNNLVHHGNEAVLDALDFMEYFIDDPNTRAIMALLEGVRATEKFLEISRKALIKGKPIIVMKVGKTEAGGIRMNIKNKNELDAAHEEILINVNVYDHQAESKGVLIQEMVLPGKKVIIGASQDPQFGAMIMLGLGGIFVEVFGDFSLRRAPLQERDAWDMIREIEGYPILEGRSDA